MEHRCHVSLKFMNCLGTRQQQAHKKSLCVAITSREPSLQPPKSPLGSGGQEYHANALILLCSKSLLDQTQSLAGCHHPAAEPARTGMI